MELLRSLMFTPGQRENMIEKALSLGKLGPDAVMFDLEDSVPLDQKDAARRNVAAVVLRDKGPADPVRIIRVNSKKTGRQGEDISAVVHASVFAVLLPKIEEPAEVCDAAHLVEKLERHRGIAMGTVRLIAAIESARGVRFAHEIAESTHRLCGLMFGAEDYSRDLGLPVRRTGPGWDLVYARSTLVNAAAMAGLFTMDQVHMNFQDLEAEKRDAIASRQLGFSGKAAIHPSQVQVINEVFSPTLDEVNHARFVIDAFDRARAAGIGCVMLGGQVVEQPILERAERVVQMYDAIASRES